ncbi:NUDIX hydrolase [Psychroflexus sp. ALD_RP9]|uniref:NUDIX hydrolase n=1 Tax=Psychroflexus sp. ALD_RP9 TaxID=2777186 RepID=UPI001A8F02C3|nr:NUDIX domain-containing protein [Psychroflexus sp. ALD_RP9]QSS97362.1 NUDIX domain-containing protein [Psychroflexus sp. ALD_RP9]
MYKVFVNDVPIILSTDKVIDHRYLSLPIKGAKIKQLIKQIEKGELRHLHLYHKKEHKLLKHLKRKLKPIVAGGGKVFNQHGEILFIYRNKKWDLPKGKMEKGETIEDTAIREVEEETLVEGLQIVKPLEITYHVMKRKGKYRLKITHWYEMYTEYDGTLIPQRQEGITRVKWKNKKKAIKALQKSYANIKLLFTEDYFTPSDDK